MLNVLAPFALIIFELALYGVEGIAQRHIDILVGLPFPVLTLGNELALRGRDVDVDLENLALVVMLVRRFDNDLTAYDLGAEALQMERELADSRLHCRGRGHVPKRDLQRQLHDLFPTPPGRPPDAQR